MVKHAAISFRHFFVSAVKRSDAISHYWQEAHTQTRRLRGADMQTAAPAVLRRRRVPAGNNLHPAHSAV
ncbi:hypothetical protein SBA3_760007 [Candidatus Sulfopaludibacter sp. SbA3]|nr:hypothetical protein SBA3_760007 [Candidatus Sulfopaludibacter sp. SbA3]